MNEIYSSDRLIVMHSSSQEQSNDFQIHCHTMYEILYIVEGDICYQIEGYEYTPGAESVILIAPGQFHGVRVDSSQRYKRISIHFDERFIDDEHRALLTGPFHQRSIYYPQTSMFHISRLYHSLAECFRFPQDLQGVALECRALAFITQVCHMCRYGGAQISTSHPLVQQVLQYINRNLAQQISLNELSDRFYISKNHLNVLFQKATGSTINRYIRLKRLAAAQKSILSGSSVGQAAESAGFRDYSNFYRAYRQYYGVAPSDFDS